MNASTACECEARAFGSRSSVIGVNPCEVEYAGSAVALAIVIKPFLNVFEIAIAISQVPAFGVVQTRHRTTMLPRRQLSGCSLCKQDPVKKLH
ncbi:hypothetical protein BFJ63_vAg19037 [Fusarium oxysporum f. sp. narcissi]|uniref:Uncharacterized protein n=1 Tax=Fusarium oxysporum f. sp. narcissi TaxID=451672 RepID=A0A4Q2V052_FUSOX|nr:hypothetical protein BFJ63_vAg19037 [Fusarium oxysporum f. sp. narcissi]